MGKETKDYTFHYLSKRIKSVIFSIKIFLYFSKYLGQIKYIRVGMIRKGGYTKFVTKGFVQERDNISHGTLKKTNSWQRSLKIIYSNDIPGRDLSKLQIACECSCARPCPYCFIW